MAHGIQSDKYLQKIMTMVDTLGKQGTADMLGIKIVTVNRRINEAKQRNVSPLTSKELNPALIKIKEMYSEDEIKAIAKGGRVAPGQPQVPIISFEGQRIRVGLLSDTHIGSIYTDNNYIYQAFEEFKKEHCDFITHGGDVTEGMSNRAGHVYELTDIGYSAQKAKAIEIFSQAPAPVYMIDGNHDRWYVKSNGAYIVKEICKELGSNAIYLGQDEGDISLKGRTTFKLWHGEDGNSYALSYRMQKIVESLSGGEKPGVIAASHTHKSFTIFERNIYCISTGSIMKQSKWMRGKRIAAHVGFWIIDIWINKIGVAKIRSTWYPFYA